MQLQFHGLDDKSRMLILDKMEKVEDGRLLRIFPARLSWDRLELRLVMVEPGRFERVL